jgi:hypothetical protein
MHAQTRSLTEPRLHTEEELKHSLDATAHTVHILPRHPEHDSHRWRCTAHVLQVPTSMHALSPLVDFVVRVDNQGEGKPVLKAVMQVSGEGTAKWGTLQQYFR